MKPTCVNCIHKNLPVYSCTCVECEKLDNVFSNFIPSTRESNLATTKSNGSTADYYELPKDAKQLQDLISYVDMNAQMGEIFRAVYRFGRVEHSPKLRDAKKIKFYIEAEIERLEKIQEGYKGK